VAKLSIGHFILHFFLRVRARSDLAIDGVPFDVPCF